MQAVRNSQMLPPALTYDVVTKTSSELFTPTFSVVEATTTFNFNLGSNDNPFGPNGITPEWRSFASNPLTGNGSTPPTDILLEAPRGAVFRSRETANSYRFAEKVTAFTLCTTTFIAGLLWAIISFFIPFRESVVCSDHCGCEVNEDGEVIHRNFHLPDSADEIAPYRKMFNAIYGRWYTLVRSGEKEVGYHRIKRISRLLTDSRAASARIKMKNEIDNTMDGGLQKVVS